MNIIFRILIRFFGFWNVYYGAQNPRYFLLCPFLGHKWHVEQEFQIIGDYRKPDSTYGFFSLLKCLRCGCNRWR